MQPIASTYPFSTSTQCNLRNDAMCTISDAPPPILRPDWENLAWLASRWSKPLDLDACPTPSSSSSSFVTQPTNHSPLGFEAQIKILSRWFWGPNHQIIAAGFEAQTEKPEATGFEPKPGESVELGSEAKPRNTRSLSSCTWCRTHTTSSDLSTVRPPST
jgi:hypothetical protein